MLADADDAEGGEAPGAASRCCQRDGTGCPAAGSCCGNVEPGPGPASDVAAATSRLSGAAEGGDDEASWPPGRRNVPSPPAARDGAARVAPPAAPDAAVPAVDGHDRTRGS
jgi:hypothetical protein